MERIFLSFMVPALLLGGWSCHGGVSNGTDGMPSLEQLRLSTEQLLARVQAVRDRADSLHQDRVLGSLPENRYNGPVFRFDDHLAEATVDCQQPPETAADLLLAFEFDGQDPSQFAYHDYGEGPFVKHVTVENGVLRVAPTNWRTLTAYTPEVAARDLGEVEIRLRLRKGTLITVGLGATGSSEEAQVTLPVTPDDRFHTYRLPAVSFTATLAGEQINRLLFRPYQAGLVGDAVEVDFIRLQRERHTFRSSSHGVTDYRLAGEQRRVLFQRAPGTITYSLELAEASGKRLDLGVAVHGGGPLTYRVSLSAADGREQERELISGTTGEHRRWQDHTVDLPAVPAGRWRLTFEAAGQGFVLWANPALYERPRQPFNAVIIIEDALRADHLSLAGYFRATTPYKAELAATCTVFTACYSQATCTRPSCASLFTSLYPTSVNTFNFTDVVQEQHLTLAEVLRSQGFVTCAIVQNGNAGTPAGLHQGYSYIFDLVPGRADTVYGELAADWIERHRHRNFFLYLHLLDPHAPYDPPQEHRVWSGSLPAGTPTDLDRFFDPPWVEAATVEGRRARYDEEILGNDRHLDALFAALRRWDLQDHSAVVFTSDHGEHLGEHGIWGHKPPGNVQVVHVPMIWWYPFRTPVRRNINQPVASLDIMPTILELAGIEQTGIAMHGSSLVPLLLDLDQDHDERAVFSEEMLSRMVRFKHLGIGSLFFPQGHLMRTDDYRTTWFDLVSDPHEQQGRQVEGAADELFQSFLRKMSELGFETWSVLCDQPANFELQPGALDQLRALGYVD